MRQLLAGSLLLIAALFVAGCARFPANGSPLNTPPVSIYTEITLNGHFNPAYYYFFAVNTDPTNIHGPVPVVTGPELGNGWGTLSGLGPNDPIQQPPFYVIFNGGSFQEYRDNQPIGRPVRGEVQVGNTNDKLVLQIDARDIEPTGTPLPSTIQVNWITMMDLTIPPQNSGIIKQYDGFGPTGYEYLAFVPLDQNRVFYSGQDGIPEELPNDTTDTPAIDMIGWEVSIQVRQGP